MRPINIRSYLDILKREKELCIIDLPVDPYLELAEIQRRTVARHGPALLFTSVKGTAFPVATNLFGTRRRIELAFGEDPSRFVRRVAEAVERLTAPSFTALWDYRDLLQTGLKLGTKSCRSGPVLESAMNPPRLKAFPQIWSWPMDGGPFLTLPLVYTEHPVSGKANIGMYRNQIFDDAATGMHFQIHRGMGFHYHAAEIREDLSRRIFFSEALRHSSWPPSLPFRKTSQRLSWLPCCWAKNPLSFATIPSALSPSPPKPNLL